MRAAVFLSVSALAAAVFAAEELPRNPFWPDGYEGVRHPISDVSREEAERRLRPPEPPPPVAVQTEGDAAPAAGAQGAGAEQPSAAVKAADGARKAPPSNDVLWAAASRKLTFGGEMNFGSAGGGKVIVINDRAYGEGDRVSVNYEGARFTWKVVGIDGGAKVRLERVRFRPLNASNQQQLKKTEE